MSYLTAVLASMSTGRTSKTFHVGCVTTFMTSFCLFCSGLYFSCSCGGLSISFSSCWYLYLNDFDFDFLWFLWCLLGGNSVCWWFSKCSCAACGSFDACLMYFAVDLEDSNFFASCLTLLAGNLSKSRFESFIVLKTNSSSLRKNQKMSLCKFLQFLVDIWPN